MRTTFIINRLILAVLIAVALLHRNWDWFAALGWLCAFVHNERAEVYRGILCRCGINDEGENP